MIKGVEMERVVITLFVDARRRDARSERSSSTTRNSWNPFLPRTHSVCLSLSGSVEEEAIGWSMPDSSDEDILLRKYAK
jgi:hypothetical protein